MQTLHFKDGDIILDYRKQRIFEFSKQIGFEILNDSSYIKKNRKFLIDILKKAPPEVEYIFKTLRAKELSFEEFKKKGVYINGRKSNNVEFRVEQGVTHLNEANSLLIKELISRVDALEITTIRQADRIEKFEQTENEVKKIQESNFHFLSWINSLRETSDNK